MWEKAKAFILGLEQAGYILATGKRDYVLVDLYGHTNTLPKLTDDRQVRTMNLRAFLGKEFPTESLPSVEDARDLAAKHRRAMEDFAKASEKQAERENLRERQAARRGALETEIDAAENPQREERAAVDVAHRGPARRTRAPIAPNVAVPASPGRRAGRKGSPGFSAA